MILNFDWSMHVIIPLFVFLLIRKPFMQVVASSILGISFLCVILLWNVTQSPAEESDTIIIATVIAILAAQLLVYYVFIVVCFSIALKAVKMLIRKNA